MGDKQFFSIPAATILIQATVMSDELDDNGFQWVSRSPHSPQIDGQRDPWEATVSHCVIILLKHVLWLPMAQEDVQTLCC